VNALHVADVVCLCGLVRLSAFTGAFSGHLKIFRGRDYKDWVWGMLNLLIKSIFLTGINSLSHFLKYLNTKDKY
jgi:hypothetical protein